MHSGLSPEITILQCGLPYSAVCIQHPTMDNMAQNGARYSLLYRALFRAMKNCLLAVCGLAPYILLYTTITSSVQWDGPMGPGPLFGQPHILSVLHTCFFWTKAMYLRDVMGINGGVEVWDWVSPCLSLGCPRKLIRVVKLQ